MPPISSFADLAIRLAVSTVVFCALFVLGSLPVASALPAAAASEPGLLPPASGLLVVALTDVAVVAALVLGSRWHGVRLAVALAVAWYGATTLLTQIETAYFLSSARGVPGLLPRLFWMGVPTAFAFVPFAVWMLGRWRRCSTAPPAVPSLPASQWAWKLALLVAIYLLLYWGAGYFIAWQNPELRAFYGEPGDVQPFVAHTRATLRAQPLLLPLQCVRALLWVGCALPLIRGSALRAGWTALAVGLFFALPPNVAHVLENPLMPVASVRSSHLVETASSNFVFGAVVVWLLHRPHRSLRDLLGAARTARPRDARSARGSRGDRRARSLVQRGRSSPI